MCLDRVYKVYKGTGRTVRTRYKLFLNYKGMRLPLWALYNFAKLDSIPKGLWLNERLYRPYSLSSSMGEVLKNKRGEIYPAGWHVYEFELFGLHALERRAYTLDAILARTDENVGECSIELYIVQCKGLLAKGIEREWYQDHPFDAPVEVYKYIKIEKEV